jgi:hypothetical protein
MIRLLIRARRAWLFFLRSGSGSFFCFNVGFRSRSVSVLWLKKVVVFFGFFEKFFLRVFLEFFCSDGHVAKLILLTLTWLSRISILIGVWQRAFDVGHLKVLYQHCIEEWLRLPPMKSLYQKLIKIDILLSHVQLNKISMVTSPSKLNKTLPKNTCPKSGLERF